MKKFWKIFWLTIIGLVVLFAGFVFYNGYQYSKFYDEAKDMRGIRFSSSLFNEELSICSLAYSDSWEIGGLENNKCVVNFNWDNDADYDEGTVTHNWIACNLPYELYSEAERIEWGELVDSEFCKS